jgi:transcription initiation factor TFIIB
MASSNQRCTQYNRTATAAAKSPSQSEASSPQSEQDAKSFDTTKGCEECRSTSFARSSAGEWYCMACGAVQTAVEVEFTEPKWRPRNQRRTAPSGTASRIAVGTTIGTGDDADAGRWARLNKRLRHDRESLRHGLKELRAVAAAIEASDDLTEQAAYLYRRSADEGLLPGQSIESMAAACVHATARDSGRPFPMKEVGAVSPVGVDEIRASFSKLVRELDVELAPPLPTDYLARFASEAGLSHAVRRHAHQIGQRVIEAEDHVGQSPTGMAAALLYGAAQCKGKSITQEELASIAFVSPVTLSRQWQTVQEHIADNN